MSALPSDDTLMQFRASDAGAAYVQNLMDTHGASRTQVCKAMFKVASQFPDRIGAALAGEELGTNKKKANAAATTPVAD